MLNEAGFEIRKWSANNHEVLRGLPDDAVETDQRLSLSSETREVKTLGIHWNPVSDEFNFHSYEFQGEEFSKRIITREAGIIFDPLGWLSPSTVIAKITIQQLCLLNIDWNEEVPPHIKANWIDFRKDVRTCNELSVPRWIQTTTNSYHTQMHAFCDASDLAYGVCVYVHTYNDQQINVQLLTAKTKVAPTKIPLTPRLELCGARLLSQLIIKIHRIMDLSRIAIYIWSDSSIVLDWIDQALTA